MSALDRYGVLAMMLAFGVLASPTVSAVTVLTVDKSGDDVILTWTGTGTVYDGARATDAAFTSVTTQFVGFGGTSHTYDGAVSSSRTLEFFDVTDEVGDNRGGTWNGGTLPPLSPVADPSDPSTNLGDLFIGSTGVIRGSGFSSIPEANSVCFEGGVCTPAISSSATEIQFITPPGAFSGPVTVTVGDRSSDPAEATVLLEDPATGWDEVTSIGFSRQDQSYWMVAVPTGGAGSDQSVFRVYFDTVSGTWQREARGGGVSGFSFFCSKQTTDGGDIFCSEGVFGPLVKTYVAQTTNPASNLTSCMDFMPSQPEYFIRTTAAAVDANVTGTRQSAIYVGLWDFGSGGAEPSLGRIIKKLSADCTTVLDENYGNFLPSDPIPDGISLTVDPVNGDLYYATYQDIRRITPSETFEIVKTGFSFIESIAVSREGPNDPGVLLVTDTSTGLVSAVPLDNPSASFTVAVPSLDAAGFGAQVSGGSWVPTNANRTVMVRTDGNTTVIEPHPLVDVTLSGPFRVRISSPKTAAEEPMPFGQSLMRPSRFGDTSFSRAVARLEYRDGLDRFTCAATGDPGVGSAYDPAPADPALCNKPRAMTAGDCENFDALVASGPGSFASGGALSSCKTCGSAVNPCTWEFNITNRYAGDDYKVYFSNAATSERFMATSDVYTSWKHVHIERERMCNVGAVLFDDYGATGLCGGAGQPVCCGTGGQLPCNQIRVYDFSNVANGHSVVVFDEENPYETADYTRTVTAAPVNNGDGTVTLTLDSPLPQSYRASDEHLPAALPHVPDFANGHSGGVCVDSGGFVEADLSDLRQGLEPACVDYHVPAYGLDGSGTVPTLPTTFFDLASRPCVTFRFSRVWNSTAVDSGTLACPGPDAPANGIVPSNVLHTIPAFDTLNNVAGFANFAGAFFYILDTQIGQDCAANSSGCAGGDLDATRRWTVAHESGHHFEVNKCSSGGHDTRDAWCGAPGGSCVIAPATHQGCLMNAGISTPDLDMRADGVDHFCKEDLVLGDPTCVGTPREGAIRTLEDPQ